MRLPRRSSEHRQTSKTCCCKPEVFHFLTPDTHSLRCRGATLFLRILSAVFVHKSPQRRHLGFSPSTLDRRSFDTALQRPCPTCLDPNVLPPNSHAEPDASCVFHNDLSCSGETPLMSLGCVPSFEVSCSTKVCNSLCLPSSVVPRWYARVFRHLMLVCTSLERDQSSHRSFHFILHRRTAFAFAQVESVITLLFLQLWLPSSCSNAVLP